MRHFLPFATGLIALYAVLLPASAECAPILYTFSGQVSVSSGSSPAAIGGAITGTFTYDPDAPLSFFGDNYAYFSPAISTLSATVDGVTYPSAGGFGETLAHDAYVGGSVPYDFFEFTTFEGPGRLALFLLDTDVTLFSTFTSLPAQLPLSQFEHAVLTVTLEDGYVEGGVVLTQAAAVPEPATFLLLGAGLCGLAARYRRSRT